MRMYLRISTISFVQLFWLVGCTSGQTDSAAVSPPEPDCCSCSFTATKTYVAHDDFQCSFDYPAHWEAQHDKWENIAYVQAPRCEQRCPGSMTMAVTVSTGRDNNADIEEELAMSQGVVTQVGSVNCGGRSGPAFRPPGTSPEEAGGALTFHVGNNDGLAYDARAQFSCSAPGEWLELEKLFLETFR